MGLFNKLKNALFEEEEIEIDSTPDKIVIKDEEPNYERKAEPKTEDLPLENERELFKVENTFNFPEFDEEEFVTNYEPPKETRPVKKVEPERKKPENVYYESKVKITREKPSSRRDRIVTKEETVKKVFKPSPVISPVYGILDKNYKKEDVISVEKTVKIKKTIDVDMVRKKAFGTLEEDIEKTLNEPMETFYNDDAKSIDELLSDSIDDTIEIKYDDQVNQDYTTDFTNSIEEELDKVDENLEVMQELPKKKEERKEYTEENTLENDLFDLIDSMYDNREEE